jgi:hypothetical protein
MEVVYYRENTMPFLYEAKLYIIQNIKILIFKQLLRVIFFRMSLTRDY